MSELRPALTPEEWDSLNDGTASLPLYASAAFYGGADPGAVIAIANAALPDDDPRKITWQALDAVRECLDLADFPDNLPLADRLVSALASYLPPRVEQP